MLLETVHQCVREHARRRVHAQLVRRDVLPRQGRPGEGVTSGKIAAVPARDIEFVLGAALGLGRVARLVVGSSANGEGF